MLKDSVVFRDSVSSTSTACSDDLLWKSTTLSKGAKADADSPAVLWQLILWFSRDPFFAHGVRVQSGQQIPSFRSHLELDHAVSDLDGGDAR